MSAIYLDHAAATPLDNAVLQAMQPYLQTSFYNPSALYAAAQDTRKALEASRAEVAHVLGARPSEIIFTAGGTESDNLAVHGVMRRYPQANMIASAIEHDAVLAPAQRYTAKLAPVSGDGLIDLAALEQLIDDQTVLVSIMYANNEIGTVQPIRKLSQLVQNVRRDRLERGITLPLYLHSDACQAANYLTLQVARLGVDMLTLNGGKIYGPKQSGVLYVKGGLELQPLIDGGGQERGLRSGTENVAACVGFAAALTAAQDQSQLEGQRLRALQQQWIAGISNVPGVTMQGSGKLRLPNNVHLAFAGKDNERLLLELDAAGIQAAAGSACSASSDESSHVLKAIGMDDVQARSSLRFTMGRRTTAADVTQTLAALRHLVA